MQGAVKLKGWMQVVAATALVTLLAACGGGSGSSGTSGTSGSSGSSGQAAAPNAPTTGNTTPITVAAGVASVINIPTVTVTVCAPGTATCQTINNVQMDTGSYGLRIVQSALNSTMQSALKPAVAPAATGSTLAECANFADGFSWGTVRSATVQIAGETATNIPIQVIGDLPQSSVPAGCSNGASENTTAAIGANGILGIGVAQNDCGTNCASAANSNYYACNGSICAVTPTPVPLANQVANPVARFATDNNGVIVELPTISATGAPSATGTLVFGINTATNNALAATQSFTTDAAGDLVSSTFNGRTVKAFFDSGSNAYFFTDSSLAQPACPSNFSDFYCPSSTQTVSVNLVGVNGVTAVANLNIVSAATLFASGSSFAFNDLAGPMAIPGSFDIGLPFFYGLNIYYGIDQTASGGQQPFVAY
jgi:hypothetical protein